MDDDKPTGDSELNRISVKPPNFWKNKPKLWFIQLEAQFANSSIIQDLTKYNTVVAALDENVLDFVIDILTDPPVSNKYEALKNALLTRLTDTEESRIKKLLTDMDLGDKRPSDLLRQMKGLAGNAISEDVVKSLWLQRLPQQAQAILAISKDPLDNIAEMADKIICVYNTSEAFTITKALNPAISSNLTATVDRRIEALEASIASLHEKFEKFTFHNRARSGSRHSRNGASRSRSNSAKRKYCWYHFKFGENAKKCTQPCAFKTYNTSLTSEN